MKSQKKMALFIIFCLSSTVTVAEHLPLGSDVLADCHHFFSKGKIKRLYKEQYVVNFYKDSKPVLCTPFAWSNMFLVPYQTVTQYKGKIKSKEGFLGGYNDEVFRVGDRLKIAYKAISRGQFFSSKYSVVVKIKEINSNGAAQLETVEGEDVAQRVFRRWIGTNYVLLDFSKALVADKLTILEVEKE